MANYDGIVDPVASWADVPSISTSMPLLGGASGAGPMNGQAVALTARTKQLASVVALAFPTTGGTFTGNISVGTPLNNWTTSVWAVELAATSIYANTTTSVFASNVYADSSAILHLKADGWAQTYRQESNGFHTFNSSTASGLLGETPTMRQLMKLDPATGDQTVLGATIADGLQMSLTPAAAASIGKFQWNNTDGTADLLLKGGNVTLQVGQEQLLRVLNNTGSAFTDGQVVYITGAQGNRTTVALANANSEATSSGTIGIVTEPVANNQEGFITLNGLVRGLNTSAFLEGDLLFLDTTAGVITKTAPAAPNHAVRLGWCVRAHATAGSILVNVDNGYELSELHDVTLSSPVNNDVLTYETASGVWKNKPRFRYMNIIAVEKATALVNGSDIIGTVECPLAGTITEIRAKTTSGTATVTFNNGGGVIGSVAATSSGVSVTSGLTNTAVIAFADLTFDVSSAAGSGLTLIITIQE